MKSQPSLQLRTMKMTNSLTCHPLNRPQSLLFLQLLLPHTSLAFIRSKKKFLSRTPGIAPTPNSVIVLSDPVDKSDDEDEDFDLLILRLPIQNIAVSSGLLHNNKSSVYLFSPSCLILQLSPALCSCSNWLIYNAYRHSIYFLLLT